MSIEKRIIDTNVVIHAFNTNGLAGVERLMDNEKIVIEGNDKDLIDKIFKHIRLHQPFEARNFIKELLEL